jgi:deazaflavin-dependent oxidoreductase (nitroreductase family)
MRRVVTLAGALVLAVLAAGIALVLGMRAKSPPVLNPMRRVIRDHINPKQLESAGKPGAYASVIRHTGRRSGKTYETPVGAEATGDGFVIGLVYGTETDWLKNVLASGSAVVVNDGQTYQVGQPEVISLQAAGDAFSASDQRSMQFVGVSECLRVRKVGS